MKAPNYANFKLLVVDDIAANRDLLVRYFGARGFQIVEADCGLTALSMIKHQHFDAVLLDIIMPEIDGIEVLRRIRASHTQADLPVIMVSGQSAHRDVRLALDFGANDYVTKPVDLAVALTKLLRTLGALPDKQTRPQVLETARANPVDKTTARTLDTGMQQGAATQFRKEGDPAHAVQLIGKDTQEGRAVAGNFRDRRELRRRPRRQLQGTAWLLTDEHVPPTKCTIADLSELGACVVLQSGQHLPNHFTLLLTENGSARRNCRLIWRTGSRVGIEFTSVLIETGKERPQIGASIDVSL
jgi:CheY-like chemotaxis protein